MQILYGVPSEGMGHATRSKVIIEWLISKKYDVQIVTSGRAYDFLNQHFPNKVHLIDGYHLAYKNAEVSITKTFFDTLKDAPKKLQTNYLQYKNLHQNLKPDFVISDFESFTHFYAKANKLPLISIDNIQILNRCKLDIEIPNSEKNNFIIGKTITKAKVAKANHYFISSFFQAPISKKNTSFVTPIIRNEILKIKPTKGRHILVYQTSTSQNNLIEQLLKIEDEIFFVFGFNKDEQYKNVHLKKFSETEFVHLLADAKAVICNGGYSFISEAVYLHKPICSVPIANQIEQFINAAYVQKYKFGRHFNEFTADNIKSFLYDITSFENNLSNYYQDGNKLLFDSIENWISKNILK
ncbi:MAG: hypothetical protein RIQ33_2169 [Bacteroidota bacterium]|jgi:uncharacterized protein (TIGR00661 family)